MFVQQTFKLTSAIVGAMYGTKSIDNLAFVPLPALPTPESVKALR